MFDTTFFKFLIAFIIIIGISSFLINYIGGLHTAPSIDIRTAQPAQ